MTKEEEEDYNNQKVCHICKKEFIDDKIRDHCHYTGKYRGAAHNTCNLRYKIPKNIPVDSKGILSVLGKTQKNT